MNERFVVSFSGCDPGFWSSLTRQSTGHTEREFRGDRFNSLTRDLSVLLNARRKKTEITERNDLRRNSACDFLNLFDRVIGKQSSFASCVLDGRLDKPGCFLNRPLREVDS